MRSSMNKDRVKEVWAPRLYLFWRWLRWFDSPWSELNGDSWRDPWGNAPLSAPSTPLKLARWGEDGEERGSN